MAIIKNHVDMVKLLLNQPNVDLIFSDIEGYMPIHYAVT